MMQSSSFDKFISGGLISKGCVCGVVLLSRHGQVMYSYGSLKQVTKEEISQFMRYFGGFAGRQDDAYNKDLSVQSHEHQTTFKVYQKTYASVYATSSKGSGGLTVCNLPYGILVCMYDASTRPADAIKNIETFCDIMRR